MSNTRPLLVDPSHPPDENYQALVRKCERLQDELADAKLKIQEERNRSAKALRVQGRLRQQLSGLYSALRGVMEDLPEEEVSSGKLSQPPSEKWERQKQLFAGRPAEVIDMLLLRPGMNTTALATALRCDPRTITKAIHTLNKAGLIEKSGGNFSLKEI